MAKTKIYKAQWPLSTNLQKPQILIYEADKKNPKWSLLPATSEFRKELFFNKYIRVYFKGTISNSGELSVDEFVRKEEWL